jgi:hypothetical protein
MTAAHRRLRAIDFMGVPGTSNTTKSAPAKAWIDVVRDQARNHPLRVEPGERFAASIEFHLARTLWKEQESHVDNLLKAFLRRTNRRRVLWTAGTCRQLDERRRAR